MCLNWETGNTCLSTCIIARERAASSEGAMSTPCHGCLAVEGVEVCLDRERNVCVPVLTGSRIEL